MLYVSVHKLCAFAVADTAMMMMKQKTKQKLSWEKNEKKRYQKDEERGCKKKQLQKINNQT